MTISDLEVKLLGPGDRMAFRCPHCEQPRLVVTHDGESVPPVDGGGQHNQYWLQGVDIIPGLYEQLVDRGWTSEFCEDDEFFEKDAKTRWDATLLRGRCPACGGSYMVVGAAFAPPNGALDFEWIDTFFYGNCPATPARRFEGTAKDHTWLIEEFDTHVGRMHRHIFGPFALDEYEAEEFGPICLGDPAGIWAHGRRFLLQRWKALQALVERANLSRVQ